MNEQRDVARTPGDAVTEAASWMAMLGILVMALFPFALPGVVLVVACLVPLLVLGVLGAVVAAVLAPPVLVVRTVRRRRAEARS